MEKFQLLDLTHKTIPHEFIQRHRAPMPWLSLKLQQHTIKSAETVKFLGININNKLNWKGQVATALAKGQDWVIQFRWLVRMSRGAAASCIHQLYLSIAIPRMLYGADVFLTPQKNLKKKATEYKSNQAAINKLVTVQRQAVIMITGA